MSMETRSTVNRGCPHFRGVPSFFCGLVQEAAGQFPGYDYSVAGHELARHTANMVEDGDEPGQEAEPRLDELWRLIQESDDVGVIAWYRREFPKCMTLVPSRRRGKFLQGIYEAFEAGIMG